MTWVEVTVPQLEAARQWWETRTPEEREAQWPKRVYRNAAALFPCRWGVFSGCEAAYHAMTLMDAGMICKASQDRPEDAALQLSGSGRDDKAISLRRVPRLTESGNGLYVRVGGRR